MDLAYDPAPWQQLYLMAGGAAAVLTGLIFVAVSLHPRPVLADRWLRGRAESSLLALMVVLLISGAVLIPSQPRGFLGAEVAALALVSPIHGLRGLRHLPGGQRLGPSMELGMGMSAAMLAFVGGLSLILHWGGGLWLLLPGGAIALASAVWNAWRLMVEMASDAEG